MSLSTFQLISTTVQLGVALWLFAWPLPNRDGFWGRVAIAVVTTILVAAASTEAGFSLYPSLTDDISYLRAIGSFFLLLVYLVATQKFLWECSLFTAIYCSTSAYLLQNLSDGVLRLLHISELVPSQPEYFTSGIVPVTDVLATLFTSTLVYLVVWQLITRYLHGSALQRVRNAPMLLATITAILVSIIFDLAIKDIGTYEIPTRYQVILSLVHLAMGVFVLFAEFEILYNHALKNDLSAMERAVAEQERQFELSRSTINAINRRCHDIRHTVTNTLRDASADGIITREELADVVRDIDVYESVLRTGNAALDVVLTEKGLLARQAGITLSCVADGHALDCMSAADLYALFSAMLDKSLEAVGSIKDPQRKSISLNVRDRMGMAAVSVEHYLPAKDTVDQKDLEDGSLTLKTIGEIVERYDGTMSHTGDDDASGKGPEVMHINLLIPQVRE